MMQSLKDLEEEARSIGRALKEGLAGKFGKDQVGFCLMLFDFGPGGSMTYISSAQRADMLKAIKELLAVVEGHHDTPPSGRGG